MKKVFVNFKSLGFVALAAAVLTFSSCTKETTPEPEPEPTVKCTESRDDNFESTTDSCNSAGTVAKFIGNWKATLSGVTPVETYDIKVSVATSADYTVTVETNYGVSAPASKPAQRGLGADKAFIAPLTMNYDVAKNKATHAAEFTATPTSSKIKDVVFTVTGSTATFTYNLDGASYTDTVEKL